MAEPAPTKEETIENFVNMVDPQPEEVAPEAVEEIVEAVEEPVEDALAEEEIAEPVPEGEEKVDLVEYTLGEQVYEVTPDLAQQLDIAKDVTQKTQALSADRKTLEAQMTAVQQLSDHYNFYQSVQSEANDIQKIQNEIEQYRQYKRQQIDKLTPTEFMQIDSAIDELNQALTQAQTALQSKEAEFHQAQEQSQKELLDQSNEAMRSRVQNWNDEVWQSTKAFGESMGFTSQELDIAVDPRARHVLWMAAQYQSIKDGTNKTVAKVTKAPVIQPKARRSMSKETQDQLNLRKQLQSEKLSPREKRKLVEQDVGSRWQ